MRRSNDRSYHKNEQGIDSFSLVASNTQYIYSTLLGRGGWASKPHVITQFVYNLHHVIRGSVRFVLCPASLRLFHIMIQHVKAHKTHINRRAHNLSGVHIELQATLSSPPLPPSLPPDSCTCLTHGDWSNP